MKIKLQEILDRKNISVYSLSKEIGVTQNNLGKLVKGETTSIKYDILEKLCVILKITPNDIFEIEPQLVTINYTDLTSESRSIDNLRTFLPNNSMLKANNLFSFYNLEKENSNVSQNYNEIHEIEQIQERLDLEYSLEENLESIIDNIISTSDLFTLPIRIRKEIEAYSQQKVTSFQFKFTLAYRSLYALVVKQSNNKQLIDFISRMIKIYTTNGGLYDLSDDDLNTLITESDHLLNNKPKQKD